MNVDLTPAVWRKSSRSSPNGQCVEVARNLPNAVAMRDSKDPGGPALVVTPTHWTGFTAHIQRESHNA